MSFDAEAFLNYFGFDRIKNHDELNVMASCFKWENHTNEDRKRSFGIRKDTGVANCYVCGGWSLEQLTADLMNRQAELRGESGGYNEFDALTFLQEKGWLPEEASIEDIHEMFASMDGVEIKKEEVITQYLPDSVLDPFLTGLHKRSLQRGETLDAISVETARSFEIGYDRETKRIIIPVRDEFGGLVGVTSRATLDGDFIRYGIGTVNPAWQRSQWTNEPYEGDTMMYVFDKRHYVFGENTWYTINQKGERILKHHRLLVLESPLDVVYAFSQGLHKRMNIGAIFGSKLTKEQKAKILRHPVVIEALDNDKPGIEGREGFHKAVEGKCTLMTFDSYGYKDLGDCTPEEVQRCEERFKSFEESLFDGLEIML